MKNCEDICRRLNLYLDNELQGEERAAIEAHLQQCVREGEIMLQYQNHVVDSFVAMVTKPIITRTR